MMEQALLSSLPIYFMSIAAKEYSYFKQCMPVFLAPNTPFNILVSP